MTTKSVIDEYLAAGSDFGFSGIDDVEKQVEVAKQTSEQTYKEKLDELEKLVMPLYVNLLKTADKDTIYWPNRKEKIEAEIEKILAITRG